MTIRKALAQMTDNQLISWLDDHRQVFYGDIARIRKAAKPIRERKILDKTLDQYRDDFKRVEKAGGVLKASGSAKSFWKLRAAASRVLADRIFEALAKADRIRKKKGFAFEQDLAWASFVVDELLPLEKQLDQVRAEKWNSAAVQKKHRSHRQRPKLGRLPEDWQTRLFARMSKGKYGDAVAVAAVAGVRPAELENGVQVAMHNGKLAFVVEGAKCTEQNGQKRRVFEVDANSPMAERLKKLVANGPKKIRVASAKLLSNAVWQSSQVEFKNLTAPPSIYAFRHAFCAEAKQTLEPVDVAQVMGHASTSSQVLYGMKSQGSGGLAIEPLGEPVKAIRIVPAFGSPPSQAPAPSARREARQISAALSPGGGAAPRPRRFRM